MLSEVFCEEIMFRGYFIERVAKLSCMAQAFVQNILEDTSKR